VSTRRSEVIECFSLSGLTRTSVGQPPLQHGQRQWGRWACSVAVHSASTEAGALSRGRGAVMAMIGRDWSRGSRRKMEVTAYRHLGI